MNFFLAVLDLRLLILNVCEWRNLVEVVKCKSHGTFISHPFWESCHRTSRYLMPTSFKVLSPVFNTFLTTVKSSCTLLCTWTHLQLLQQFSRPTTKLGVLLSVLLLILAQSFFAFKPLLFKAIFCSTTHIDPTFSFPQIQCPFLSLIAAHFGIASTIFQVLTLFWSLTGHFHSFNLLLVKSDLFILINSHLVMIENWFATLPMFRLNTLASTHSLVTRQLSTHMHMHCQMPCHQNNGLETCRHLKWGGGWDVSCLQTRVCFFF